MMDDKNVEHLKKLASKEESRMQPINSQVQGKCHSTKYTLQYQPYFHSGPEL